jgi:hypothetical protein
MQSGPVLRGPWENGTARRHQVRTAGRTHRCPRQRPAALKQRGYEGQRALSRRFRHSAEAEPVKLAESVVMTALHTPLAAKTKCLAQSNKSRTRGNATKKRKSRNQAFVCQ